MPKTIAPKQEFQDVEYQPSLFTKRSGRIFHPDKFCRTPEDVPNLFPELINQEPKTAIGRILKSMKNFIFGNKIVINTVVKYGDGNVNINNK